MKKTRVPDRVTSPIRKLCNRIALGTIPQYVKVIVEVDAKMGDCFANVKRKIERDGGNCQHGWVIWHLPRVLMEAEFHAVWRSPVGELIDISPQPIHFKEIMFLADPRKTYEGRQINNIRIPLNKDPKVKEFIRLQEERFKIINEGELAYKHGNIAIPAEKIIPLMQKLDALSFELGIHE